MIILLRDSEWMANIYNYVGLSVGTISGMDSKQKKLNTLKILFMEQTMNLDLII